MTMTRWIVLCLLAALLSAGSVATHGRADDGQSEVARAEAFAAEAFDAYLRKDYGRAIELYLKAMEASPSADIVYNLARIYDLKLKDHKLAMEFYRRYTLDTGADPARVRVSSQRLTELRELEAVAVGPSEVRPSLLLRAAPLEPPPDRRAPAAPAGGLSSVQLAGLITGAAGLASMGVGAGFGFAAKSDNDVAQELCDGNACRTQRGVDAARDARRAATVSTVAFIAGAVLVTTGVTLLIAGGQSSESERPLASLSLTADAAPSTIGARVLGQF